ncbi:MAG: hypothetical protein PVH17_12700 [Anaerolineae bacterium]|jgi:hypothetical protein
MEETPVGFLIAFLLPFHVGGGAAVGVALRRIVDGGSGFQRLLRGGFLLLWGVVFGGLPLMFGLTVKPGWFVLLQLAVFLGTIVLVAVRYEWLRALYSQPAMFVASFGFAFFVVGLAVATSLFSGGDPTGLLVGLIFAGVGGILTLVGVWMLLREL